MASLTSSTVFGTLSVSSTCTATDFNTTSDHRLKENVTDLPNATDYIERLRVVEYNFKNKEEREVGLIAHELQSVLPNLVSGEKDGEEYQTISLYKLVPYLIKTIQESNEKIEDLQSQINELKNQ